ncbi:MAG TPA: O-antigen ligase family protein, partial [Caldilineaceae bacterium]|nr:O-antigen ligase family protein [Caldilineaceae bacterium]
DIPAYLGVGISQIVAQPVTDENFSVIERLAHWLAAVRMWEMAPWLGVGPGNYATLYPDVRLPLWEDALGHAHNIYLNVLAETGLIGLTAYLLMWAGIVGWLWRRTRQQLAGSVTVEPPHPTPPHSREGTGATPSPQWGRLGGGEQLHGGWERALLVGVLGVIAHLSVHNLFDNLYVQGIHLHIALWLGAAAGLNQKESLAEVQSRGEKRKI